MYIGLTEQKLNCAKRFESNQQALPVIGDVVHGIIELHAEIDIALIDKCGISVIRTAV